MKENSSRIAVQRIIGVSLTVGVFVLLTVRGQEIPDWVQRLMVLSVGTLIVGAEKILEFFKVLGSIKFTLKEEKDETDDKDEEDK